MTQRRAKSARIAGKEEFKPGELVRLKSGGAVMTVNEYRPQTSKYSVWWMNEQASLHTAYFPAAVLKRVKAPL